MYCHLQGSLPSATLTHNMLETMYTLYLEWPKLGPAIRLLSSRTYSATSNGYNPWQGLAR